MKKQYVDFHAVEPHQREIHSRLENWASWCIVRPRKNVTPMFKLYMPPPQWEPKEYRPSCDVLDAQAIEKVVGTLPPSFAFVLRWWYVYRYSPAIARRELATSSAGLQRYLRDGRQMVLNLLD